MKKLTKYLFIITLFFISIPYVLAKDTTLYFFYGEGCPHCAKEEIFLKEMEEKYQNLKIKRYETYGNLDNYKGHVGDVCELIRVAVTSQTMTPDLYEILKILDKESIKNRIIMFKETL